MARKRLDVEARVSVKDGASKNVKKIESNFKKLTSSVRAGGVAIVASLVAIVGAIKLLEASGERLGQKRSLERTLTAQGIVVDEYVGKLKSLANNQIATSDIILASNRALALGIAADDLPGLLEAATKASVALGISATQAFNDITTGVGRASPLILDNLGIVVDAVKIYKNFAEAIGSSVEELTKQQKTAALAAAVMENAAKGAADFATAQSAVTVALAKSKTALKEWFEQTVDSIAKSEALATAIVEVSDRMSDYAAATRGATRALLGLKPVQEEAKQSFFDLQKIIATYPGTFNVLNRAVREYGKEVKAAEEKQKLFLEGLANADAIFERAHGGLVKLTGAQIAYNDAQEEALKRRKRIEASLLAEASALDTLRTAIGEVTQAELQKELDEITLSLEAARIETGGNTAAFVEMAAKVSPIVDHLKARIKGLADGTGDIGEALETVSAIASTTGDQFDDLGLSVRGTTNALASQSRQARITATDLRTLTGVAESLALAQARTALAATQAARARITGVSSQFTSVEDYALSPFGTGGRYTVDARGNLVPA